MLLSIQNVLKAVHDVYFGLEDHCKRKPSSALSSSETRSQSLFKSKLNPVASYPLPDCRQIYSVILRRLGLGKGMGMGMGMGMGFKYPLCVGGVLAGKEICFSGLVPQGMPPKRHAYGHMVKVCIGSSIGHTRPSLAPSPSPSPSSFPSSPSPSHHHHYCHRANIITITIPISSRSHSAPPHSHPHHDLHARPCYHHHRQSLPSLPTALLFRVLEV